MIYNHPMNAYRNQSGLPATKGLLPYFFLNSARIVAINGSLPLKASIFFTENIAFNNEIYI